MELDPKTLEEKVLIMQTRLIDMNNDLSSLQTNFGGLKRFVVEGENGKPSMAEVVRDHDKFIAELKSWFKIVATAIVLQTITFGTAAVVYFVKLYPLLEKLSRQP